MASGKKVRGRRRYQTIDNIIINGLCEDRILLDSRMNGKREEGWRQKKILKMDNIMINGLYKDTKRRLRRG